MTLPASFIANGFTYSSSFWSMEHLVSVLFCGFFIAATLRVVMRMRRNAISRSQPLMNASTATSPVPATRLATYTTALASWLHRYGSVFQKLRSLSGPPVAKPMSAEEWRTRVIIAAQKGKVYAPLSEIRAKRARYWGMARNVLCLLGAFTLGFLYSEHRHSGVGYPIEEYRDVKVLKQFSRTEWLIRRSDGDFRWNCCPDFPCDTVLWPGYLMKRFRYQERGWCKSIVGDGLGAFWATYPGTNDVVQVDQNGDIKGDH